MVIPPEQEQLTPEEEIFDLIDSIQSKISSEEYLNLMNTAQLLVQKIKDGEQDEEMSVISDSSSSDEDRIHEGDISMSSDSDSEIEETSDDTPCDCVSRFAYPEDFPISGNNRTYSQMFCHGMRIFECENFQRLCHEYPLLNNLIERQNMPFADRETYATYNSPKVKMFFSILLSLNDILDYRHHKIIISLILFDFAIKNIQFIADSRNSFGQVAYDKFISFMQEEDFPEIAEEFNINLENWRLALERAIAPPIIN
jgi:hypothetical protein